MDNGSWRPIHERIGELQRQKVVVVVMVVVMAMVVVVAVVVVVVFHPAHMSAQYPQ